MTTQPEWETVQPGSYVDARGITRDERDRPLIDGQPYQRVTTYIKVLSDTFHLDRWTERTVMAGMLTRPDLLDDYATTLATDDHKAADLDKVVAAAKRAGGGSTGANLGSAMHTMTEADDKGETLPALPDAWSKQLHNYQSARRSAGLAVRAVEGFTVNDKLAVAGTFDRIYRHHGIDYIGDVKTGKNLSDPITLAMQLAVYSRSRLFDGTTRTAHGCSTNRGIIVHMPAHRDWVKLHWLDLETGWEAVQLCKRIYEARRLRMRDLMEPVTDADPERPSLRRQIADARQAATREAHARKKVVASIRATDDLDALRAMWDGSWPDGVKKVAIARAELLTQSVKAG